MNFRTILYSILGICGIFLALFAWSTYRYYDIVHADDPVNPLLRADSGMSKIIRKDLTYELSENEESEIQSSDIIETGIESKATITWPDKSITRLGPKTRIVIEKMYASANYDDIEIAYTMERGKVWNTIIRSLVGDSYFEVHLPRESVVAGVRGTIFEINLENKYIRAINHSTHLSQKNQSLELLPGELVDSENILIKKGKEWLDATWNDWNAKADSLYESVRSLEIQTRIENLTRDIGKLNLSNLSRNFLVNIPGFEDISVAESLKMDRLEALKNVGTESLISYYQKLGNFGNTEMKESLRNTLLSLDNSTIAKFRNSLESHAFWESIDTGVITKSTEDYLKNNGINVDNFKSRFIEGAKNDLSTFQDILSGSLIKTFSF